MSYEPEEMEKTSVNEKVEIPEATFLKVAPSEQVQKIQKSWENEIQLTGGRLQGSVHKLPVESVRL